jgi:hypothetical protein
MLLPFYNIYIFSANLLVGETFQETVYFSPAAAETQPKQIINIKTH